jgi:hypothetical protein
VAQPDEGPSPGPLPGEPIINHLPQPGPSPLATPPSDEGGPVLKPSEPVNSYTGRLAQFRSKQLAEQAQAKLKAHGISAWLTETQDGNHHWVVHFRLSARRSELRAAQGRISAAAGVSASLD